jgi:hypothetical protein
VGGEEHLQDTSRKYRYETKFLRPGKLQLPHLDHRQNQDREIGEDVYDGAGDQDERQVETFAVDQWMPNLLTGVARHDLRDHDGDVEEQIEEDEAPDYFARPAVCGTVGAEDS